jgi:hypothetical protein
VGGTGQQRGSWMSADVGHRAVLAVQHAGQQQQQQKRQKQQKQQQEQKQKQQKSQRPGVGCTG